MLVRIPNQKTKKKKNLPIYVRPSIQSSICITNIGRPRMLHFMTSSGNITIIVSSHLIVMCNEYVSLETLLIHPN